MKEKYFTDFRSPGSEFRGKPFWAWNGKLEPTELKRQIRIFHRMGLGGFFMHSRVGLDTEYLGEEWFECVRACIDQAQELGMEAWLYDEDRWPSGAAGGLVTSNPDYRQRHLVLDRHDAPSDFEWTPETLAAFTADIEGSAARDVRQLEPGERAKVQNGKTLLAFRVEINALTPWHNGQTYLDTMNEDAVKEFIRVTHEEYSKKIGDDFGDIVPGIFTDEPNYGRVTEGRVPWTGRLPDVFRRRYGYDLLPHLVELMFDVDDKEVSRPRYHYYDCITQMFVDAFARQIGDWCELNNIQHTGHVLAEETLTSQTGVVGSAMRFYEYMQAPGIDILTEHRRELNTAKQCSSVANQFGRQWRLSETNGCTGWDLSFESHKAISDWQAACGINLRCQHLSWYTMLGQAKRDYPASISYQSPWWEHYEKVEDYFARINAAMNKGREVRDLLVIHPIESVWAIHGAAPGKKSECDEFDRMFCDIAKTFAKNQIDFDYGDEDIISRKGSIEESGGEAVFRVDLARYRAVLVPPLKTIRTSTLELLEKFQNAGGLVVFAGEPPHYADARPSEKPAKLASGCCRVESLEASLEVLEEKCRRITVTGPGGENLPEVMYLLKEDEGAFYLFTTNTGYLPEGVGDDLLARERRVDYPQVCISGFESCKGAPAELDAETGNILETDTSWTPKGWEIHTSLPRIGSRLFLIPKEENTRPEAMARRQFSEVSSKELDPQKWNISLSEDNCLVLDRARHSIGDGDPRGPEEILRVDSAVRDALGIERRGGRMVQPWAQKKTENPRSLPVRLTYEFNVDCVPAGGMRLALECPGVFDISLNGNSISPDSADGWWVDKSLETLPVDPALLKEGKNELILQLDYTDGFSGLEIVYLLGDFGTAVDGTSVSITAAPLTLKPGDWCEQGLSFYSGSVCYRQVIRPDIKPGQRLLFRLGDYRGVAVRVVIDGSPAGIVAWEPNEIDITDLVPGNGGEVELGIEVIGHRRNSHGPLHIDEKWPNWTGSGEFTVGADKWYEGYQLVPVGLMSPPSLVIVA